MIKIIELLLTLINCSVKKEEKKNKKIGPYWRIQQKKTVKIVIVLDWIH